MIKTTIRQYDIKHSGDEMDRLEILSAFADLARLCEHSADVTVTSEKTDLISVVITEVDQP